MPVNFDDVKEGEVYLYPSTGEAVVILSKNRTFRKLNVKYVEPPVVKFSVHASELEDIFEDDK
jgi:hypothetical protein